MDVEPGAAPVSLGEMTPLIPSYNENSLAALVGCVCFLIIYSFIAIGILVYLVLSSK